MTVQPRSVKFDPEVWELAAIEAGQLGISTAEFVRGAVLARALVSRLRRDPDLARSWAKMNESPELLSRAQEFLESAPLRRDGAP